MSATDVAAINAHTDAVMANFFASLSHGMRTDGKTRNGVGMDQIVAALSDVQDAVAGVSVGAADLGPVLAAVAELRTVVAALSPGSNTGPVDVTGTLQLTPKPPA